MHTSKLSTLLVSALAVLALAATGCKKSSDTSQPPACALKQLDAACGAGAECCSGSCASGICVKPAGECGAATPVAALCAAPSDCCLGACPGGTCVDPAACGGLGASCTVPSQCCSGSCEGSLGAKVCTQPPTQCKDLTVACAAPADCCSGYCDGSSKCATPSTPTCVDAGGACSADSMCCSALCGPTGKCATDAGVCSYPGEPCGSDAQCCSLSCPNAGSPGATCSSTVCLQVDQSCASGTQCCSGVCSGSKCAALPPGSTGATCGTLGEACAVGADCCSTDCQGATGGLKNGTCRPAAACQAPGDVCYRKEDCCSGLCAPPVAPGEPGRCADAPGGCGQDGVPCAADSQCCTRKCVDLGAGATVCLPAGGCRMTGDYCDHTASCCGGTNPTDPSLPNAYGVFCDGPGVHPGAPEWDTRSQDDRTCTGGQACNPPGNICGYKASQNCCYDGGGSGKVVCKPDANGILRCFGGPVTTACPTGWNANDPQCCIAAGAVCQFRDQCCGFAPCVPDATGVLRCAQANACLPQGAVCSTGGAPSPDPCCAGTSCQLITEVGWACSKATGTCALQGQACNGGTPCCFGSCISGVCGADCGGVESACTSNAQCCSGVCDAGFCRASCVPAAGGCTVNGDCCSGLSCAIPPGATTGTCQSGTGPTCATTGQACGATVGCCSGTDTCTSGLCTAPPPACSGVSQTCTATGGQCCSGLACMMPDAFGNDTACLAGGTCYCAIPCAPLSAGCSTIVPCCTTSPLRCADNATQLACSSTDSTKCSCVSANL